MKNNIFKKGLTAFVLMIILVACENDLVHDPYVKDNQKPLAITSAEVTSINGGLHISYDLPKNADLLYVKAIYNDSHGEKRDVKASRYVNSLEVLGFDNTEEVSVDLVVYDRSENASPAYTVKGKPLTPPKDIIKKTLDIKPDYSGAKFTWENENLDPITIFLLAKNNRDKFDVVKTVYSSQSEGVFTIRGFEPKPRMFAAVIRDRYDNFTDTIYPATVDKKITPLFEQKLEKELFKPLILENDASWDAWEGDYASWYDDNFHYITGIVHTPASGPWPRIMSLDLGQTVKLSRFKLYQRGIIGGPHFAFKHGNPKEYAIFGAKELPKNSDGSVVTSLAEGAGWIKLRDCESINPQENGGTYEEKMDKFYNGDEYDLTGSPEVRYIRIAIYSNWDGAGYVNASEVTFWGNPVN